MTMITAAGLKCFRYPGGSNSDEDTHFNVKTSDHDTIPQFVQLVDSLGGVAEVTLNYGSGSPQEAAAELAYIEGSPNDTTTIGNGQQWNASTSQWVNVNWQTVGYWASLRAAAPLGTDDGLNFMRLNHSAPFTSTKYWEVGNEQYGSWEVDHHSSSWYGPTDPATYATFCKTFQGLANEITNYAQLPAISIGVNGTTGGWTQTVLGYTKTDGFTVDFISDHNYPTDGQQSDQTLLNVILPGSGDNWSNRYTEYQQQYTAAGYTGSVPVLGTEWNATGSSVRQMTGLVDGLFAAESIGCLLVSNYSGAMLWDLRNAGYAASYNAQYGWRNWADFGILGCPPDNPPLHGTYICYPTYFGVQLASKLVGSALNVVSTSSSYSDLPVYAATQTNAHVALMVINTNPAADITDQITISGFTPSTAANACNTWQYGKAEDLAQSITSDGSASLSHTTFTIGGSTFNYTFPAYSMTVIDLAPDSSDSTPPSAPANVRDGTGGTFRSPTPSRSCRPIGTPARITKVQSAATSMPSAPRPAAPKPSIGPGRAM